MKPFVINALAPTRICDVGGWTDTRFARTGAVFNVAIYPPVEVQVRVSEHHGDGDRVTLAVENYNIAYTLDPERIVYDRHPLIEAAVKRMAIPEGLALHINIYSAAPPGASMGTSAAVSVALIGALNDLAGRTQTAAGIAAMAHAIETGELGLECGVQDQLASAHGGINYIEIAGFPRAIVSRVEVPDQTWWEFEHRLLLAYIGKPHDSSAIHRMVIAGLGASAHEDPRIEGLRRLAGRARDALRGGDFGELGRVFNENTELQRALHPGLVGGKFEEVIALARDFGALGCKVNGAGGDGGSIAILTGGDMARKRALRDLLDREHFPTVPLYLARRGLRVWRSRPTT